MAEVWAAHVEGPEGFVKPLALKFVVDSGDPEMDRLFVNEARLAAQLQHPNLVTVFDFDRIVDATDFGSPGRYYIAMERVDGLDLRRVLQASAESKQIFPVSMALYVAAEVLQGLRYVHERHADGRQVGASGLVHREVSPHNILIAYGGDVKLSDFGIAKTITRGIGTQPGVIRGKLAYASPEQIRGRSVDHRSDQFSLGVTLWEMLAGRRLYPGGTEAEVMARVLTGDVPALPEELTIDPAIEATVRRMLESDVDRRFPSTTQALSQVMALPAYSGDGGALGVWMRKQFPQRDPTLPATMILVGPDSSATAEVGSTRLMPKPMDDVVGLESFTDRAGIGRRTPSSRATPARRAVLPLSTVESFDAFDEHSSDLPRPLVDFATRAPFASGRRGWVKWGLVAGAVGLMGWAAAWTLRTSSVSASANRPVSISAARPGSPPAVSSTETASTQKPSIEASKVVGAVSGGLSEGALGRDREPAAADGDRNAPATHIVPTVFDPATARKAQPESGAPAHAPSPRETVKVVRPPDANGAERIVESPVPQAQQQAPGQAQVQPQPPIPPAAPLSPPPLEPVAKRRAAVSDDSINGSPILE